MGKSHFTCDNKRCWKAALFNYQVYESDLLLPGKANKKMTVLARSISLNRET